MIKLFLKMIYYLPEKINAINAKTTIIVQNPRFQSKLRITRNAIIFNRVVILIKYILQMIRHFQLKEKFPASKLIAFHLKLKYLYAKGV
jgi:hypothetical protein